MTNQGEHNSLYYAEFIIGKGCSNLSDLHIGFSRKLVNQNKSNRYTEFCYTQRCGNCNYFYSDKSDKGFGKSTSPGSKIAFLIDMYHGSIKVFVDNEDVGYAITDNNDLKNGVYYLTLDSSPFKGTVSLVQPPSSI